MRRDLEASGYAVIAFPTGYKPTELLDADVFLTPPLTAAERLEQAGGFNGFETMLFSSTAGRLLVDADAGAFLADRLMARQKLQRAMILSTFDRLTEVAALPGPKFVFAHVTAPHRPYFFAAYGTQLALSGPFTLGNLPEGVPWRDEIPRYVGQLEYVNSRLEQVIDAILAASDSSPVIVLQSDHGPDLGIDWGTPDQQSLMARVSILNAYYLPAGCASTLYPHISPVNSFRVVFNCLLGPTYALLPDVAYYNPIGQPTWDRLRSVEDMLREMGSAGE